MRLREWMTKNNWTAVDMGRLTGISAAYISAIRTGKCRPSEPVVRSIMQFTNGEVSCEEIQAEYRGAPPKARKNPFPFQISQKSEKCGDENDMHML
jgi:transcriptional regulator with XRE-family HTH domain